MNLATKPDIPDDNKLAPHWTAPRTRATISGMSSCVATLHRPVSLFASLFFALLILASLALSAAPAGAQEEPEFGRRRADCWRRSRGAMHRIFPETGGLLLHRPRDGSAAGRPHPHGHLSRRTPGRDRPGRAVGGKPGHRRCACARAPPRARRGDLLERRARRTDGAIRTSSRTRRSLRPPWGPRTMRPTKPGTTGCISI